MAIWFIKKRTNIMKKVVISGITGQDGSYMAEYLLEKGYNIVGAARRTSQLIDSNIKGFINHPNFRLEMMDLCDSNSITELIKNERPDYFINLGAATFVSDSWNVPALHMQANAISLIHILEAVRNYSPLCRVYSAGSSEMWGDVSYSPQDENHPMSPRSMYGVSKVAAKFTCKVYRESYGLYVVHGTLLNHESERRQKYFVTRKITSNVARIKHSIDYGESFRPLELGNLDAKRDWSHAGDFVSGIWMMLNQEEYNKSLKEEFQALKGYSELEKSKWLSKNIKEYVLSSNETHSIREFVELSFSEVGIHGEWVKGIRPEDEKYVSKYGTLVAINPKFYRPADVEALHGNSNLIRKQLKWNPQVSFKELVKKMVQHDISLLK